MAAWLPMFRKGCAQAQCDEDEMMMREQGE
jgi:hypothetical protein